MEQNQIAILSIVESIKNINANQKSTSDSLYDRIKEDLPNINGIIPRKIDDYKDVRKSKKTSQRDIFEEVIQITNSFLSSNPRGGDKNKLLRIAQESAKVTLHASKQIVIDSVTNGLFAGNGICGSNKPMPSDTMVISPKEFDFLNMLTVDPDSITGKIMYETDQETGFVKMNREFYNNFTSGETIIFNSKDGSPLFNISWDESIQKFNVSGLQGIEGIDNILQVQNFLLKYYESIEYPDIDNIFKQSMYFVLKGDKTDPTTFQIGFDWLERLLQKLFSICGSFNKDNQLNQNPINQSVDEDPEWYFNFEELEGIDLEEEDARARGVLRFADCGNFEVPINPHHQQDFLHWVGKKPWEDNTSLTLDRTASEAYEASDHSISIEKIEISLYLSYLKKLPRALISSIISPKLFFPIVAVYKLIKSELENIDFAIDVKELMKQLSRVFHDIIKKVFWKFLREFWNRVKKELLIFVKDVAKKIITDKLKRYKTILTSLLSFLLQLLEMLPDNCEALFDLILKTIKGALNARLSLPLPGFLLAMADQSPGFSNEKASMNIVENLYNAGVPTGTLFGRPNKLISISKSIVSGITQEIDENGFVEIALKFSEVEITPAGVGILKPTNKGSGKFR